MTPSVPSKEEPRLTDLDAQWISRYARYREMREQIVHPIRGFARSTWPFHLTLAGQRAEVLGLIDAVFFHERTSDALVAECERLRAIAEPALAYVAARERNDGAEPCDWSARAAEVDRTWHALKEAAETLQGVAGRSTEPGDSDPGGN